MITRIAIMEIRDVTLVKPSTSASGSQPSGNTKKDKIQQTPSSTQKNKPTGQTFTIVGNVCPLTRITTTAEVPLRKPIAIETDTPKPVVTLVYSRKPKKSKNNIPVSKPKIIKSISANKKEPSKSWGSIVFDVPSSSLNECRNDHVVKILGYGDHQIGNITISRVYYVEGHRHNLFFVGQLCDSNLEVSFRQHTCFIRNLEGVDLLTRSRGNNLYTLYLGDMMASSPICLLSKASKTKSWLWHRHLSHLNFGAINHLARHGLIREAVATACYTKLHDELPDLSFFHVFGALCYPTNDSENLGKLQPKADIDFDELTAIASEHSSLGPTLHEMTHATISPVLVPNPPPSTSFVPPLRNDWDILFQPLFYELLTPPPSVDHPAPEVIAPINEVVAPEPAASSGSPSSTTVDQDAPSPSNSQTTPKTQCPVVLVDVEEDNHDLDIAHMNNDPFFGIPIPENHSKASSSSDVIRTVMHTSAPYSEHVTK
ncbi:retrovirus-related pol polyprotein from transposon TNT 1-94 [Tanacetum coccineum]